MIRQADPRLPAARVAGDRLYVVSGCSGSGKSTLIAALAQHGEAVAVEPGRAIVKAQLAAGEDGLPWANPQRFIDICAAYAIADLDRRVRGKRRTFFDRSFIDVASAVERSGCVMPGRLRRALKSKRGSGWPQAGRWRIAAWHSATGPMAMNNSAILSPMFSSTKSVITSDSQMPTWKTSRHQ